MKNLIIATLLTLAFNQLNAQTKYGILTFNAPANYTMTKQNNSIVFTNSANNCQITIYATEQTAVTNEAQFLKLASAKQQNTTRANQLATAVKRSAINNDICFGTKLTASASGVSSNFYSYSNGKQTFYIQLNNASKACISDFNTFWSSFLIDAPEENNATLARRARKAAPAAPAAPAPAM